jgi:dipeptidyl-peptidase-3
MTRSASAAAMRAIVEVNDPEATKNMRAIHGERTMVRGQFSPLLPEHKKKDVVGITYRFINTVGRGR